MIELLNEDCMAVMARYPDKYFDLAIVDPPYGIGQDGGKGIGLRKKWIKSYAAQKHLKKDWDNLIPNEDYFIELNRVSKNQIIWGGNYFNLPPTKGIIAWDKVCDGTDFSHFELAWSSFDKSAKMFRIPIQTESQIRIHPTQKPILLYRRLFTNYADPNFKILDTHLGSGSSAIAAHQFGISEFVGCEIDLDYYNAAVKRFNLVTSQTKLF